jgi:hypothetical protein
MNDPEPLPPTEPRRHETTDANVSLLAWSAAGLALVLVLVFVLLRFTFMRFEIVAERTDSLPSALASNQTPPAPRLETNPSENLAKLRQHEDDVLSSYAWIDKPQSVVRIPINRAIHLLAERGLPEPAGPVTEKPKP